MRTFVAVVVALGVLACSTPVAAQTSMVGSLKMIRTGWNDDSFAVVSVENMPNPAGCSRSDGYITHKSLAGYNTYYAAALAAYATHRRVMLVVHNTECYGGWPKLIGINLIIE
jgi:hypothetical protein